MLGGANMTSVLHKLDLRTLSVTFCQPNQSDSGLGEQTKGKKLESVILEVAAGRELVLLQVNSSVLAWRRA